MPDNCFLLPVFTYSKTNFKLSLAAFQQIIQLTEYQLFKRLKTYQFSWFYATDITLYLLIMYERER